MTIYQAKISSIVEINAPDEYDPLIRKIPSDDFIVTRDKSGNPLSRYGDLAWDRTPYDARNSRKILNFKFWVGDVITAHRQKLVHELHWIMFILIWLRPGHPLSNATLDRYLGSLRELARQAELQKLLIKDLLTSKSNLKAILPARHAKCIAALITLLSWLGVETIGFECGAIENVKDLHALTKSIRENTKQTPPIPTRIYSALLGRLSDEIAIYSNIFPKVQQLYEYLVLSPNMGREYITQRRNRRLNGDSQHAEYLPSFQELLEKCELTEFWKGRGCRSDAKGLLYVLSEAQSIISMQIQAFTGMRYDEVINLPYSCLEEVKRDGDPRPHYIVKGTVTKLSHGKIKRVKWITSSSGSEAIRLAQRFALMLYKTHGIEPSEDDNEINNFYLFPNPSYGLYGKRHRVSDLKLKDYPRLRARLCPIIENEDLLELENIDPFREWNLEKAFKVGHLWPLASHQFRRSLALYAQASGLVSLPSLKRQLQHITIEMSLYYSKGSAFAKNFIGDVHKEKHFGQEYQEMQPVSQYLAYAAQVLMGDQSDLFGGHGQWAKLRLRDDEGNVLLDRKTTMQRFTRGEMAYRPTPLGGCISVDACKQTPIQILNIECLENNCKNFIGDAKKVNRVISVKTMQVEKLKENDATSPEYRIALAELQSVSDAMERIKRKSSL
jgi:hypothetical protein